MNNGVPTLEWIPALIWQVGRRCDVVLAGHLSLAVNRATGAREPVS
jgi:hypothetical protein